MNRFMAPGTGLTNLEFFFRDPFASHFMTIGSLDLEEEENKSFEKSSKRKYVRRIHLNAEFFVPIFVKNKWLSGRFQSGSAVLTFQAN